MIRYRWVTSFLASLAVYCTGVCAEQDSNSPKVLTTSDVVRAIEDESWILVDTRPGDAYNGWKLDGIQRGGHLPGAVDFPATWLDSDRDDKGEVLSAALRAKGIEPQRHVVLYGTDRNDLERVATYLRNLEFRQLYYFDLNAWADDESKPLERYENFHLLVPPKIVKRLLAGERPETFELAKQITFAEVSWGDETVSYSQGHLPRSFHVNTDHFEPPPKWMLAGPDVLRRFVEQYGIGVDDTLVLSGEDPTACFRLAVVLRYIGVEDVRVLNGGFAAWRHAKYPIETVSTTPARIVNFQSKIPSRPELIVSQQRVKRGLESPEEFTLIDTRTWAEFTGETSGYTYHSHKGRIPDSVYGQADFKGNNSLTPYRNIDNTMRNADEIQALWKQSGIDVRKHMSFMCGGGWRAAEVLTYANVMGLTDASLYSDGWIGWSNNHAVSRE